MAEDDIRSHSDEVHRLLHALEVERNQLIRNIETCRIRDIEHQFIGEWALKDIVGHVTSWEAEVITSFHELREERRPELLEFDESRLDAWNEDHVARKRSLDFWSVMEQLHSNRERLLEEIAQVDEEDLVTEGSIHNRLVHSVIDHDRDHWHQIAARLAGMAGVREAPLSVPHDARITGAEEGVANG